MLNPLAIKIGASALAIVAAFGLGWKICSWKNDSAYRHAYADLQKQVEIQQKKNSDILDQNKAVIDNYKKQVGALDDQLKNEIHKNVVYTDCKLTPNWVRLKSERNSKANQAITAK